jgi:hypothetical protein
VGPFLDQVERASDENDQHLVGMAWLLQARSLSVTEEQLGL